MSNKFNFGKGITGECQLVYTVLLSNEFIAERKMHKMNLKTNLIKAS